MKLRLFDTILDKIAEDQLESIIVLLLKSTDIFDSGMIGEMMLKLIGKFPESKMR